MNARTSSPSASQTRTVLVLTLIASFLAASPGATANTALTMLTEDGKVQRVMGISKPRLMRQRITESGRGVLADEYAVISLADSRPSYSESSAGYGGSEFELNRVRATMALPQLQSRRTDSIPDSAQRVSTSALLIQHQLAHPQNARYAPQPTVTYAPQRLNSPKWHGERGFAIVNVGESGRVVGVALVSSKHSGDVAMQSAISGGITSQFQDYRRHDHTVYMAYEVRDQTVSMLGQPIVIVPMCCGPEPPCDPVCP